MPYCLYLRKSRSDIEAEARGEGETLARHEKALLDLAKRGGYNITQIYREIVSGETLAARPVMQQLLSDVEKQVWDGVLVMDIDRLARGDTIDQGIVAQTFKYSGTEIITPAKVFHPDDEFDEEYFEFGLFMSRREYKIINRRLQRGREASVKEGKYLGNRPPYGYDRVKLQNEKGWTLTPNPEEAKIVKMIFSLYADGELQSDGTTRRLGVSLITRRLNSLHIPSRTGQNWSPSSVRDILYNPVYVGKLRWNRRRTVKKMVDGKAVKVRPLADDYMIVDGLHPPIVDIDVWERAQNFLLENKSRPVKEHSTIKNPLAGIVVCGVCGHKMVRRPYGNKRPDSLMCPYTHCHNVSSDLALVERRILEALTGWLGEYKVKWSEKKSKSNAMSVLEVKRAALKKITASIADLEKQRDNIYNLLEQGVYSTDVFLERSKIIADRLTECAKEKAALEADVEVELTREEQQKNIIPAVERLLEVYNALSSAQAKNDMLKEVLEKVVYTKPKEARQVAPDGFELVLYPRLPKIDKKA